ncbi:TetR/AcrR family transcriptional regulator [Kangiella sediminilitoris]|uniref:Transcriptional regulator, TetR family n=1 Tax=Kangiella sediminilitoris TaxID=1144748 RepID=A0A1B3B8G1_9GAMM|nr:TetR/AcrR family transcriptional regulator [Kangiella sediminilitoris]AOE49065.1 Transcriptional regulator, TetR family [Kangiella sediminilitoris]
MSKKHQILEAAVRLFVERGLQGSSMALVAKEAEVATGSVYNYFEGKEHLINECFLYVKQQEVEFLLKHHDREADYEQRFRNVYGNTIRFMLDNCPYFRFIHLYAFSPVILQETRDKLHPLYEPFVKLYEEAYAAGATRSPDILEQHLAIYGGISYLMHYFYVHEEAITEERIQSMVDFAWSALRNPKLPLKG